MMRESKSLPVGSRKAYETTLFGVFRLYNRELELSTQGNYLLFLHRGQAFKFLVKRRKRKNSRLKSSLYLIQLEPSQEYISSLFETRKGYLLEYKKNIYLLRIEEERATLTFLRQGDVWTLERLAKRWEL
jgi:hypothetical protein